MILKDSLIELLADILEIETSDIDFQEELSELENWDSVNSLRILTHIEDEFNIRLSMEEYSNIQRINELSELIEKMSNY
ncbi:acyl carrier protein [Bacillus aryabhattai]|uniref:Acyl carrier protein n=1 Tax=Priestia aryabhattai TaxID=412384 RepID=A0A7W3RHI2_PRIAR|nr:acyl carrier protein [Priestia aryabhattai]MBA9041792.1 acyl carrier protein [Priestia aryabhattai]